MKKKYIITYGTFDLLHYGHIILLQRAKLLGNKLFVGVSTDKFNGLKGKQSHFLYEYRVSLLKEINCVDVVFPESDWEQKVNDIAKYEIDMFVIGDDWLGKFDHLMPYCEVKYLERTAGISSTALRKMFPEKVSY